MERIESWVRSPSLIDVGLMNEFNEFFLMGEGGRGTGDGEGNNISMITGVKLERYGHLASSLFVIYTSRPILLTPLVEDGYLSLCLSLSVCLSLSLSLSLSCFSSSSSSSSFFFLTPLLFEEACEGYIRVLFSFGSHICGRLVGRYIYDRSNGSGTGSRQRIMTFSTIRNNRFISFSLSLSLSLSFSFSSSCFLPSSFFVWFFSHSVYLFLGFDSGLNGEENLLWTQWDWIHSLFDSSWNQMAHMFDSKAARLLANDYD